MPIATPQGTLDFKSVDKVTFVGASSNTVIDTTTGSLGVGVDVNGPTSNLHVVGHTRLEGDIDMLHTANTASIKLNSNVVTEFPRSKKLIKYPRVALTQNALNNGYAAEASTENNGTSTGQAYRAFDGIVAGERGYHSAASTYSSGSYTGSVSITDAHGTQHQGEWIKLQMPTTEKMKLSGFSFSPRYVSTAEYRHRTPYKGVFLGSTNGTGTNWYPIHYFDNFTVPELTTVSRTFENNTNDYYNHIALVVYEVGPNATYGDVLNFAEMELFGLPEYDPESDGVDVTVKSLPNVPNTDWLEVYYDAKNYTSGVVQDLSTNSFDGTLTNGASFNNSDGIGKFVFDGSNDYISGSIPSTFTGNQTYTFSIWVKPDSHPSGFVGVFEVGTRSPDDAMGLYFDTGKIIHLAYADNLATTTVATIGQWVHITGTYTSGDRRVYANGNLLKQDDYSGLTLAGTTFKLGSNLAGTQPFDGSIANFRLFNRALTSDEIYQLYAYQKEYFGHGDLGMTLKAGRLGIGTSEPRAALDVRGDIYGGCPAFFNAYRDAGNTSGAVNPLIWNRVTVNKGGCYNNVTGKFTASVSGYYRFDVYLSIENTGTGGTIGLQWRKNDTDLTQKMYGWANVGNHTNVAGNITIYLLSGDTFHVRQISGGMSSDNDGNAQSYTNGFSGFYLSS